MFNRENIIIFLVIVGALLVLGSVFKLIGFAVNLLWPVVLVVAIVAFVRWKFGGKRQ